MSSGLFLKTFYPQTGYFSASIEWKADSSSPLSFGLSGSNPLDFSGVSGFLMEGGKIIGPSNSNTYNTLLVEGSRDIVSWTLNGNLIDARSSSYNFSGFHMTSNDYDCRLTVSGVTGDVSLSPSYLTWGQNFTGTGYISNLGQYGLKVNSFSIEDRAPFTLQSTPTGTVIPSGGSGMFTYSTDSTYSQSGNVKFTIGTDAGDYIKTLPYQKENVTSGGYFEVYIDSDLKSNKSQTINFYIRNNYRSAKDFNIYLDYRTGSGAAFYRVLGSGIGQSYWSETLTGLRKITQYFTGTITGSGGRLGNTATSSIGTGTILNRATVFATGNVTDIYNIKASGKISGTLYTAYLTGSTSGPVSSGELISTGVITGVPSTAISPNGAIVNTVTDTFTGTLDSVKKQTGVYSGFAKAYISSYINVSEGDRIFTGLWNLGVSGFSSLTDFVGSGYANAASIGSGAPSFSIPSGGVVSGSITLNNDFSGINYYSNDFRVVQDTTTKIIEIYGNV